MDWKGERWDGGDSELEVRDWRMEVGGWKLEVGD